MSFKYFNQYENVPRYTKKGFEVVKCPEDIGGVIIDLYNILLQFPEEEELIKSDKIQNHSKFLDFSKFMGITKHIHNYLLPLHEQWSNQILEPIAIWGIRSYTKGSILKNHNDRPLTHHISSIIMVDKDLNGEDDWALDIQDHNGKWHKIYTEPGDMILYESVSCMHGRSIPFKGNFFRNFYMHYKVRDLNYIGVDIN